MRVWAAAAVSTVCVAAGYSVTCRWRWPRTRSSTTTLSLWRLIMHAGKRCLNRASPFVNSPEVRLSATETHRWPCTHAANWKKHNNNNNNKTKNPPHSFYGIAILLADLVAFLSLRNSRYQLKAAASDLFLPLFLNLIFCKIQTKNQMC